MTKLIKCIDNKGYEISLKKDKIYTVIETQEYLFKILDETQEEYFYSKNLFEVV